MLPVDWSQLAPKAAELHPPSTLEANIPCYPASAEPARVPLCPLHANQMICQGVMEHWLGLRGPSLPHRSASKAWPKNAVEEPCSGSWRVRRGPVQLPAGDVLYICTSQGRLWVTALTSFSARPEDGVHNSRFLFWLLLDLAFCWQDLLGLRRASLRC